ncbi:trihelix transcription factor GTL1-like isoform X2 [Aristolochia californica]|uniref:trihelix transcription factor GTL1-like isoform X2 n=1 Tax=Aristolochia californica TaxID=171875 RepID=UPI0035DB6354
MQQGGGSQYGVSPEMTQFAASTGRPHMLGISTSEHLQQQQQQQQPPLVEDASPISSRPPARNFEELVPVSSNFPDEGALAGEEAERGTTGNRWPRQETLALLKIRSEMDAAFRDATLKGPLWEDVSRKLAELGYIRSAKKCKEKFENVHKYYKRTKEGRAGRQDGKSYRFFTQLEALHSSSAAAAAGTTAPASTLSSNPLAATPISVGINPMVGSSGRLQPAPVSSGPSAQLNMPRMIPDLTAGPATGVSASGAAAGMISFSSNSSSSEDDSEEDMEEAGPSMETRKRKRPSGSDSGSRKMMAFFEGLMKQVMERQEAMQQRFLETIEKREQDRMIREEAWKRQEMARLSREHELMSQERAMAASRDVAVIAFLQKITGQTIQIPAQAVTAIAIPTVNPPPPQPTQSQHHHQHHQTQPQQQLQPSQTADIVRHHLPSSSSEAIPGQDQPHLQHEIVPTGSFDPASSRWPKAEVSALIKMRSGLEARYQEAGPKGPLWEEISAGMQRMGYNRSAKRCKEKWENINKYFKKVKESNKKRPEDAKTCPYFHQLDALYRKKILGGGGGGSGGSSSAVPGTQSKHDQEIEPNPPNPNLSAQERSDVLAIMPPPGSTQTQTETDVKNGNNNNNNKNGGNTDGSSTGGGSSLQVQTSNGGLTPSFYEEGAIKKKTL